MTPQNGEVWKTKSGNLVLIVTRATEKGSELGFVWFDPIDGLITYSEALDRLSQRFDSKANVENWGSLIDQLLETKNRCKFRPAWQSRCNQENCKKHKDLKCCSCGEQATHQCEETNGFVCGELLCNNCEHTIGEDGTNSGKLPEGMKRHCKKGEQVYLPWYMRDKENETES